MVGPRGIPIRHADLLNFVDGLLRAYVDQPGLGLLYREVVAVRLASRNVFMPDLAFYRSERAHLVRETHIDGPPDLVVEVSSNRTADRDVGPESAEYEPLVEYAHDAARIESATVNGFVVMRNWLNPTALAQIGA